MGKERDSSYSSSSKKPRRRRSSSSSDSDDYKMKKKSISYEKELERLKKEHRDRKEHIKSTETSEERRLRRLAKKERKQRKYDRLMGVDDLGYSNTNNPFGDTKLTDSFVWGKKNEKDGVKDGNSYELLKRQREKQEELRIELEKVKKRREEREREKLAREEEMQLLQREKEAAMFSGWERQEDDFHLHQARLRSSIRIRDGRAKPIDLLAAYINPEEDNLEIQMHEPYTSLVGLSIDDLEDLMEDIKVYITIDQKNNQDFWEDITIIVKDELDKLKKKRDSESYAGRRDVINNAVQTDIQSVFKGKTYSQLIALENQIKGKLRTGGSIDIGYWESLLHQLKAFMAKARLKERHQKFLKKKLTELKLESSENINKKDTTSSTKEESKEKEILPQVEEIEKEEEPSTSKQKEEEENEDNVDEKLEIQRLTEAELADQAMKEYEELNYEPKLILFGDVEEEKWTNPVEDLNKLTYLREQVKAGSTVEEEMERENMFNTDVLRENEESFNTTVDLSSKKYKWSDKYRPRKPRFFNRVHTGYEWNKYNQTHYDQDNPPPKIVQGYKFNIFYPDLIDKTKTPEYTLTTCDDDPDFCILRFKAGPPYEDIAFKVVDREWECSNRHGFRCQFYNNIFQLYFHFKRYRYRR